ncbi:MAG: cytochrome c biogenesis protein ResB [Gemmataceae bacterium]
MAKKRKTKRPSSTPKASVAVQSPEEKEAPDANGTATKKQPDLQKAFRVAGGATGSSDTAFRDPNTIGVSAKSVPKADTTTALLETIGRRIAKVLGSLQLAVTLLGLFAVIVLAGILMEHRFQTATAQQLVYQAWWFNGLLGLLAVNILFAAVKKWPFKKHQTGFVITHIGLLTMLAGGLVNAFSGTDALMVLVDTSDPEIQYKVGYPQVNNQAVYNDRNEIVVQTRTADDQKGRVYKADFRPGVLPWNGEDQQRVASVDGEYGLILRFVNWLQRPLGRHWSMDLGDEGRLEIIDYIPFAAIDPYSPSASENDPPAFKIQLESEVAGFTRDVWLMGDGDTQSLGGLFAMEALGKLPKALIPEFESPPQKNIGKGLLAVLPPGAVRPIRLSEKDIRKERVPLLRGQQLPAIKIIKIGPDEKVGNAIHFAYYDHNGVRHECAMASRFGQNLVIETDGLKKPRLFEQGGRNPYFWFHPPKLPSETGRENERPLALVQFVYDQNTKQPYYRTFVRDKGNGTPYSLKNAGQLNTDASEHRLGGGKMKWVFRVPTFYEHASKEPTFRAVAILPGQAKETDMRKYPKAIRCRLTVGEEKKEFWVKRYEARLEQQPEHEVIDTGSGRKLYSVTFGNKTHDVGFQVQLVEATSKLQSGTNSAASYSSNVRIWDEERGIEGEQRFITMNQPLKHRGYTFYQSQLEKVTHHDEKGRKKQTIDAHGRPVEYSGFTVGADLGLGLKYRGSLLLGIGIAIMFYMRAYFFKPVKRVRDENQERTQYSESTINLGQILFFGLSAVVVFLFVLRVVLCLQTETFDAGQLMDIVMAGMVLYLVWLGQDWALWLCMIVGLLGGGGILLFEAVAMSFGWAGFEPIILGMAVVFLLFALSILFLPPLKAFIQQRMGGKILQPV